MDYSFVSSSTASVTPVLTEKDIVRAFTEWERRYRDDPDAFMDSVAQGDLSIYSYGEMCAAVLFDLARETR